MTSDIEDKLGPERVQDLVRQARESRAALTDEYVARSVALVERALPYGKLLAEARRLDQEMARRVVEDLSRIVISALVQQAIADALSRVRLVEAMRARVRQLEGCHLWRSG